MGLGRRIFKRMPLPIIGLLVFAICYAFFALWAWLSADGMLFPSRASSYTTLPGMLTIPAKDGTPITAVHLPNPAARYTLLYFHGNAEDLGGIFDHLTALHAHGFAVVAMDFRSYGLTPGTPSEANVFSDATAVYRHVTDRLGVPANRVILYGRSLGSGPAVELAAREPVGGLILQNAFVSAFRTLTGVPLLPWDRFSNLEKMKRVRCPVLVLHGGLDRTVPFSHGEKLFAAAPEPKRSLWLPQAAHNNFVEVAGERYWEALTEFRKLLEENAR